jgi:hypothetical protein
MGMRVHTRLGRNTGVSLGPVGMMAWSVVLLPFFLVAAMVKGVIYAVSEVRRAMEERRQRERAAARR